MNAITIHNWAALEDSFRDGLILGNGASIAFDPRFAYPSLRERAQALGFITADVQRVFEHLHTDDFDFVLKMLWHASKINQALQTHTTERFRPTRAFATPWFK